LRNSRLRKGLVMGKLKPGATYIYERADGIIYAREAGAEPSTRQVVGYESGKDYDLIEKMQDDKLWGQIRRAAKTSPTLKDALDRCIEIYRLTHPQ
jgi:hypothetical protein